MKAIILLLIISIALNLISTTHVRITTKKYQELSAKQASDLQVCTEKAFSPVHACNVVKSLGLNCEVLD